MPKLKVYFFLIYVQNLFAYRNRYCEICPNHTLCKYEIPGPNPVCIGYDNNSFLTLDEINIIINQINKRRNFIAMGQSKFFHAAANMKKISWSSELAVFAQRWVDQCDQFLRPDKEDECRDLEKTRVGQNIATITGPSPGLNVKSFVEMWFMLSIDYEGSVTYYNQSQDFKANHFTQLIWANTDKVGCGRAKFYVRNYKTSVDRLVCNFAPRGNLHRKPIYTIGYPATQCSDDMAPDKRFPGLCAYSIETDRLSSERTVATSLLRIRNMFNDSAKQEIDPVYSNLKHAAMPSEFAIHSYKNQRILNNPYDGVKRSYLLDYDPLWANQRNKTRNLNYDSHIHERGHSKMYNDHHHTDEYDSLHPKLTFEDSRRYDFPSLLYKQEGSYYQCTRKTNFQTNNDVISTCECKKKIRKCTRGQTTNDELVTKYCPSYIESTGYSNFNNGCACRTFPTRCQNTERCTHSKNCDCDKKCPRYNFPDMLKSLKSNADDGHDDALEIHRKFHLYDLLLKDVKKENKLKKSDSTSSEHLLNKRKDRIYDYSDITINEKFKPLWQIGDFKKEQKQIPLRSLLYTTLANRKVPRSKRTRSTQRSVVTTEPITIKNVERKDKINRMTEKYLSFDELMHLRKYNLTANSGRRHNEDDMSSDKEEKKILRDAETTTDTTEYTANTPYVRLKHCTRKLTCTWTAASLTDNAGSIIPGQDKYVGSHTPPGYVEGCTRTSTCTRDFMNRNKMDTVTIETTVPTITEEDEDYCERRSLNKRNVNSLHKHRKLHSTGIQINLKNHKVTIKFPKMKSVNKCCFYRIKSKTKRNVIIHSTLAVSRKKKYIIHEDISDEPSMNMSLLSYGDIYYAVLQKIIGPWRHKSNQTHTKCFCNNIDKLKFSNWLLLIVVLVIK